MEFCNYSYSYKTFYLQLQLQLQLHTVTICQIVCINFLFISRKKPKLVAFPNTQKKLAPQMRVTRVLTQSLQQVVMSHQLELLQLNVMSIPSTSDSIDCSNCCVSSLVFSVFSVS